MLGYDLTGGDSRKILKNLRDKFEHMDGVRKDIAGRKIDKLVQLCASIGRDHGYHGSAD